MVATRLPGVPGSELSCALSADEYSGGEAAGEKTEQNDDDTVKSQEVSSQAVSFLSSCSGTRVLTRNGVH